MGGMKADRQEERPGLLLSEPAVENIGFLGFINDWDLLYSKGRESSNDL